MMKSNKLTRSSTCLRRKSISMFFLVVFFLMISPNPALADPPRPTCDDGSIGSCVDEILDEQSGMIDEVEGMLVDMTATGIFSYYRAQSGIDMQVELFARIDTLRNEHARARAANGATSDEEFDNMIAEADKEKKKRCKNSDITFYNSLENEGYLPPGLTWAGPKFGNNKCDVFAAIDDDGFSLKINERKDNMCEEVCEEKVNQAGKTKERFVGGMVDAISSARNANLTLAAQRVSIKEMGYLLSSLQALGALPGSLAGDPCDPAGSGPGPDLIAEEALQITITAVDVVIVIGNLVTEVLKTVADVADKPCKQTAMGFNASAACIPFTIAFHVAKGITDLVKGLKSGLGDAKSLVSIYAKKSKSYKDDNAKACTKEIRDEFNGPGGKIITLQSDVDILKGDTTALKLSAGQTSASLAEMKDALALLKILIDENSRLLLTPQGQRNGFPLK